MQIKYNFNSKRYAISHLSKFGFLHQKDIESPLNKNHKNHDILSIIQSKKREYNSYLAVIVNEDTSNKPSYKQSSLL